MSHFSKIKTNINDLNNLTKTIKQLGFNYKLVDSNFSASNKLHAKSVLVYSFESPKNEYPIFNFSWNGNQYILMADVQLWNLDVDFNHFIDRLFQQYAYNTVVDASHICGFSKIQEQSLYDGSVKVTLQRWSKC